MVQCDKGSQGVRELLVPKGGTASLERWGRDEAF